MLNAEKARIRDNYEKERARKEPFEIGMTERIRTERDEGKINLIAAKIAKILAEQNVSYIEANEALYLVDRALREDVLSSVITLRQ